MEDGRNREEFGERGMEDMINLLELNESNILRNLQMRYENDLIYTYTGSILVAVNPYKMFNIYGIDMVRKYEGQVLGQQPPHLFAIGSASYDKMIKDRENQVIVISGESGAGKTESTKLIMQYLAAVNQSGTNVITERILEANPLLESFGNAKTVRNDNSSRFGKYVELYFRGGSILGAKTSDYLLEKSRIVTQAAEERNYHVFYEMLVGLSIAEKQKYGLQSAQNYFYLNQGGATKITHKDDLQDYQKLTSALNVLGFSSREQETIIKMLSSVLHIGNVYFTKHQSQHQHGGVTIDSGDQIKWVCHLLELNQDWLHEALTTKVTDVRNERLNSPLTTDQAVESRDAIAKALYQRLFSWLVEKVNGIVQGEIRGRTSSLAILDIFGFEDFRTNSLEQFCINYANESLQYYFNKHIFKLEQEAYRRERINWHQITYHDNQPAINLICKKRDGIIYVLDDESNFPKGTDLTFLDKCHQIHGTNKLYEKPRMSAPQFGIKHYAGLVTYNVKNFLDKNRDTLRSDVVELLIQSKNQTISKMFSDLKDSVVSKTISKTSGFFVKMRPKTATVVASFHESLQALIEAMSKCNPWFVRCIKPNEVKAAMLFEQRVVLGQLRYTGMLETIRIRKMGYPIRYRFNVFADRYFVLLGRRTRGVSSHSEDRVICEAVLRQFGRDWDQAWQIGTSKLFLKEALSNELEKARNQKVLGAVLVLQQYSRGYLVRKRYLRIRQAAIVIQNGIRGWRARTNFLVIRRGVVKAQAQFRMLLQRRKYAKLRAEYKRRMEMEASARAVEMRRREEERRMRKEIAQREDPPLPARPVTRTSSFSSSIVSRSTSMAVAHLEIPSELGYIFSKLEEWTPIHTSQDIGQTAGSVELRDLELKVPHDINSYEILKYVNVFCKQPDLKPTQFPIKSPFLDTRHESDVKESLAIFKLILRYLGDPNLTEKKERAIADYIVQKGQANEGLRDEIYIQLVNQTLGIKNEKVLEKGWVLIANCLSCIQPSKSLSKYLLKYLSDHAYDGFKLHCQHKLLQCLEIPPQCARVYPPTLLEWETARNRGCMALKAFSGDGIESYGHVESWTTGEEFASYMLNTKGYNEDHHGWTVSLRDGADLYECNGHEYVLDLIGEMELPPAFPHCSSYFLVTSDRFKDSRRRQQFVNTPHHPDNTRLMPMPTDELHNPVPGSPRPPQPPGNFFKYPSLASSINGDYASREDFVSDSVLNKRGGESNPDLSKESILNIRYTKRPASYAAPSTTTTLTDRTLENSPRGEAAPPLAADSKMNQRYVTPTDMPKTKLNDRYTIAQDTFFTNGESGLAPDLRNGVHSDVPNGNDWPGEDRPGNAGRYAKGPNAARSGMPVSGTARDQINRMSRPPNTGRSGSDVSDLDRWLDSVFHPVLDGDMDEIDGNPNHLEHRLKGGGDNPFQPQLDNVTLVNTGVPTNTTTFPIPGATFPIASGSTTTIPIGVDPTQQLLAQHLATQQFLQQQQQQAVQRAAAAQHSAAQQLAAQQMAAQQLAVQQFAAQQLERQQSLVQKVDPTANLKAQLEAKTLENELLQKDLEQKRLKKELESLGKASIRTASTSTSSSAQTVTTTTFQSPRVTTEPQSRPAPSPTRMSRPAPSPPVVPAPTTSHKLPAVQPEIDTSRPGGVKTLKGVFEKKRLYVGNAFQIGSAKSPPVVDSRVTFSNNVDNIPPPPTPKSPPPATPKSPPPPMSPPVRSPPPEVLVPAVSPPAASPPLPPPPQFPPVRAPPPPAPTSPPPAVSPPVHMTNSTPPHAPPPPPIQASAERPEPIVDSTGQVRKLKTGKFQWPPPKKDDSKPSVPEPGRLDIVEKKSDSVRSPSKPPTRLSTTDDHGHKVDIGANIDMKSRQKDIERKLSQAWGSTRSTDGLQEPPKPVVLPVADPARPPPGKRQSVVPPPKIELPPPSPPPVSTAYKPPTPPPVTHIPTPPPSERSRSEVDEVDKGGDLKSLDRVQSVLYAQNTGPFYTYTSPNWTLEVRKEVFTPTEKVDNPGLISLIFGQVVMDSLNAACIRIQKDDQIKMKSVLERNGIRNGHDAVNYNKLDVKKQVVEIAKEWPFYFSRIFAVNGGQRNPSAHRLGVSHSGVRLITQDRDIKDVRLRVLQHFRFEDIKYVSIPKDFTLQIHTAEDEYTVLYTPQAEKIKSMIDAFCIECEANTMYVRAVKAYRTKDSSLLSFKKGDIIKLTNKNMTLDRGWLYGSTHGRIGLFPESYIQPIPLHEIPEDIYAKVNKMPPKKIISPKNLDLFYIVFVFATCELELIHDSRIDKNKSGQILDEEAFVAFRKDDNNLEYSYILKKGRNHETMKSWYNRRRPNLKPNLPNVSDYFYSVAEFKKVVGFCEKRVLPSLLDMKSASGKANDMTTDTIDIQGSASICGEPPLPKKSKTAQPPSPALAKPPVKGLKLFEGAVHAVNAIAKAFPQSTISPGISQQQPCNDDDGTPPLSPIQRSAEETTCSEHERQAAAFAKDNDILRAQDKLIDEASASDIRGKAMNALLRNKTFISDISKAATELSEDEPIILSREILFSPQMKHAFDQMPDDIQRALQIIGKGADKTEEGESSGERTQTEQLAHVNQPDAVTQSQGLAKSNSGEAVESGGNEKDTDESVSNEGQESPRRSTRLALKPARSFSGFQRRDSCSDIQRSLDMQPNTQALTSVAQRENLLSTYVSTHETLDIPIADLDLGESPSAILSLSLDLSPIDSAPFANIDTISPIDVNPDNNGSDSDCSDDWSCATGETDIEDKDLIDQFEAFAKEHKKFNFDDAFACEEDNKSTLDIFTKNDKLRDVISDLRLSVQKYMHEEMSPELKRLLTQTTEAAIKQFNIVQVEREYSIIGRAVDFLTTPLLEGNKNEKLFGITRATYWGSRTASKDEFEFVRKMVSYLVPKRLRIQRRNVSGSKQRGTLLPGGERDIKIRIIYIAACLFFPSPDGLSKTRISALRGAIDNANRRCRKQFRDKVQRTMTTKGLADKFECNYKL